MDVLVLVNPTCEHRARVGSAVTEVNQLQTYFRLKLKEASWLPNDSNENTLVPADRLHDVLAKHIGDRYAIAISQTGIDPDWFVSERRTASYVTIAEWESRFAPPPLKIYVMFQLASSLLNFSADLSDEQIDEWSHKPAIGCFFDWYQDSRELKRCMIAANLCGSCEVRLAEMGIHDNALSAIEQILAFVRAATIRRPRSTPTAVFIGHGHSDVWRDVKDYVQDTLGLPTQEFNQESPAGLTTTERLQHMLNASAFAILVMTGEDQRATPGGVQSLLPRQNVVHELGLFQGRLGLRRAVVLLEEGAETFSNIHGLTCVSFPKGDFRGSTMAKSELRATLRREGLL